MSEDLLMVLILVATAVVLIAGFWLTRNSKAAGRLPGMTARDGLLGLPFRDDGHSERFEDEPDPNE
jgi:hypothetical protein